MKLNKLFAGVLAAAMMMSIGVSAMAADTQDLKDYIDKTPVVTSKYTVKNGTAPAEDFEFEFEGVTYKNSLQQEISDATIPQIANVTVSFDADITSTLSKTAEATINAANYELGYYTYKVTEVTPETQTAGVTYADETFYLILTILRDEQNGKHYVAAMHYETVTGAKAGEFENEYNSGKLTVTKTVSGNQASTTEKFPIKITFKAPEGKTVKSSVAVSVGGVDGDNKTFTNGELEVSGELKDGESIVVDNLPVGVTYTVEETDAKGYTSEIKYSKVNNEDDNSISAGDTDSVTVVNTLNDNNIDTGVILDNAPYIVMLAVVAGGVVFMVSKKHREE